MPGGTTLSLHPDDYVLDKKLITESGTPQQIEAPPQPTHRPIRNGPAWGSLEELDQEDPMEILAMDWLVPGWIERADAIVWAGDPGIGKSLLLTAICVAFAAGKQACGHWDPPEQPFRVMTLDLENRLPVVKRRLIRLCMGLGIDYKQLMAPRGPFSAQFLRGKQIFAPQEIATCQSVLKAFNPDLFVVDTIMSSTSQENLSPLAGVNFVRQSLFKTQLMLGHRVGCWGIHHTKKPDPGVDKDSMIGDLHQSSGGGFVGMTDGLVLVQADNENNVIVSNPKQRHQKTGTRLFLKIDDGGDPRAPLKLSLTSEGPETAGAGDPTYAATVAYLDQLEGAQNKMGIPRSEIVSFVRGRMQTSNATAQRRVSSWISSGMLRICGKEESASGRPSWLVTRG